jgi:ubiquitin conjugation factor E4 B
LSPHSLAHFLAAVARDGRSYSHQVYQKASQISHQRGLLKPQEQADFDAFVQRVADCFNAQQAGDEELGEVPDDFLGTELILCQRFAA